MDYDARKDSLLSEQESEKVEVYVSCRNTALSVVAVEAHLQEGNKPRKNIYHSKPTPVNNARVDFANSIIIEYFFEYRQKLFFQVFDASGSGRVPVGRVETTVGELFNGGDKGVTKQIINNGNFIGEFHAKCEKVDRGTQGYVEFDLVTRNLDVGSAFLCFGEGGAHWKLFKIKRNEEFILHQSEVK